MCIISDKIKFCTCVDANIDIYELNHYWVLHRYNKHLDLEVMGEVIPPSDRFTPSYLENELNISNALFEKDIFDKPIGFKEKDRLQIVLNNNSLNSEEEMEF